MHLLMKKNHHQKPLASHTKFKPESIFDYQTQPFLKVFFYSFLLYKHHLNLLCFAFALTAQEASVLLLNFLILTNCFLLIQFLYFLNSIKKSLYLKFNFHRYLLLNNLSYLDLYCYMINSLLF